MSDIDWSKAPEWATHCNSRCMEFYRPASNSRGGEFYDRAEGEWAVLCDDFTYLVRQPHVIARPVAQAWTGTGLPPVGALVLAHEGSSEQYRVFAFDGEYVAIASEYTRVWRHASQVYPIRTPEQIAAEEREKAIQAMHDIVGDIEKIPTWDDALAALYDAGLRFKEAT